jgi:hypothetical protein
VIYNFDIFFIKIEKDVDETTCYAI